MKRIFTFLIAVLAFCSGNSSYAQGPILLSQNFDTVAHFQSKPTGWTDSVFNWPFNASSTYQYGYPIGYQTISYSCAPYNGFYPYYPFGSSYSPGQSGPYGTTWGHYDYGYLYAPPYSHSTPMSCPNQGYLVFPTYYTGYNAYLNGTSANNMPWMEITTPPMNFNTIYNEPPSQNGGSGGVFRLSFWVYTNYGSSTYQNSLSVYINTINKSAGGTRIDSILPFSTSTYSTGWTQFTYNLPSAYNNNTAVYITLRALCGANSGSCCYMYYDIDVDDMLVQYIPPCVPPAHSPTNLTFTAVGASHQTVSWTAINPVPSGGYLVVRSQSAPFNSSPVNGSLYAVGNTIGNGTVAYNGTGTTFTDVNLIPGTAYTYTIYPWSANSTSCSGPSYRLTSPLSGSDTTGPQMIYIWLPSTINSWQVATNWFPTRSNPDPSDWLEFTNGVFDTVTNVPTQQVGRIVINGGTTARWRSTTAGSVLTIQDNNPATIDFDIQGTSNVILDGAGITIKLGGNQAQGHVAGNGITGSLLEFDNTGTSNSIDLTAGTGTTFVVDAGGTIAGGGGSSTTIINTPVYPNPTNLTINGTYQHKYTIAAGPSIPYANWGTQSGVLITGYTNQGSAAFGPGWSNGTPPTVQPNWNQNFYNVTYNCPNQYSGAGGNVNLMGGPAIVRNSFSIGSTGLGTLAMAYDTTSYNDSLYNFLQSGGTFDPSAATPTSVTSAATQTINIGGIATQNSGHIKATNNLANVPSVTLNYYGNTTKNVTFADTVKGPVTFHVNCPINLSAVPPLTNTVPTVFPINANGGIRVTSTNTNAINTSLTLQYSPINTTLTFDTSGSGYITPKMWPTATPPTNLKVAVGLGNTVKFPNMTNAAVIAGTLKFVSGDIDISNDSLVIGANPTSPGAINDSGLINPSLGVPLGANPVLNSNMGNIRMDSLGSVTRWFSPSPAAPATLPIASSGTTGSPFTLGNIRSTPGFFPISYGTENRNVVIYFNNTSALASGGTITLRHNHTTGLQTPSPISSIPDGTYNITKETKATWSFVRGNGVANTMALSGSGTMGLKISAASLFVAANPFNIRLLHPQNVSGTFVGGSLQVATASAERQSLVLTNFDTSFCMGANGTDIIGVYTAINSGPWRANNTWDINQPPTLTDVAVINPNVTVTTDTSSSAIDSANSNPTNRYYADACKSLTIYGSLNDFIGANYKVTVDSSMLNFGSVGIGGTDTFRLNGTSMVATNANGYINNGSTSIVGSGVLSMGGGQYYNNKPFINNGSLLVAGGFFYLNGNLAINGGSIFSQYGGSIIVDGNDSSNAAYSVLANDALVNLNSNFINLSGGTLTILDPHAGYTNPTNSFQYSASVNMTDSPLHTIIFGDITNTSSDHNSGIPNNPLGPIAPYPFLVNPAAGSGRFTFSNLVAAGFAGAGTANDSFRWVSAQNIITVNNTLTVYNKGEYRMNQYPLYLNGNITVANGGTFTADSPGLAFHAAPTLTTTGNSGAGATLYFGQFNAATPGVPLPASQFQILGGSGSGYRNAVPSASVTPNAMLRDIYVCNPNWVQFNVGNVVFSGRLTFENGFGTPSRIYMAQNATLTEFYFNPPFHSAQVIGAGTLNGWVVGGSYSKHAVNLGIAAGPMANYLYPIGDSNYYTPVTLNGTGNMVTAAGDVIVSVINQPYPYITTSSFNPLAIVNRYWNVQSVNNFHFIPGTIQATLGWTSTDPTVSFGASYGRIGIDSVNNGIHNWSYPPTTPLTITSLKGSNLGNLAGITQFNGNYVVADTCPPTFILQQPTNQSGCINGSAVQFCASAIGAGLTYQWFFTQMGSSNPVANATQSCFTIANPGYADTGHYYLMVSSICAPPQYTNPAVLTIGTSAYISQQPISVTGCAGGFCDTIRFVASGTANTIKWYHNGNIVAQGLNIDSFVICPVTINDSGVYIVSINNGCAVDSTIAIHVNVNVPPVASIVASGPVSFCAGSGVTLNANYGTGYSYYWYSSCGLPGVPISQPPSSSSSLQVNTSCVFTVKEIDANGCVDSLATGISVNSQALPAPVLTSKSNTTFCQSGFDTLVSTSSPGYIYQWQVSQGGPYTNIIGANDTVFVAASTGFYRMVVTNSNNCVGTSGPVTITVVPNPSSTVTPSGSTNICNGSSVNLMASLGSGYTYQWKLNNLNIPGATNYFYSANNAGQYQVVLSSNGCTDSSVLIPVTVNNAPPAYISSPVSGTHICELNHVILVADPCSNCTYQWQRDSVNIPGQTASTYYDSVPGNYTVVIARNGCDSLSPTVAIIVDPIPTNVQIQLTGNILTVVGTYATYQWYLNSNKIPGATNPSYTANQDGIYTCQVTNNLNSCVGVSAPYNLSNLGTANVNKNGSEVRIFPNPATKIINIEAPYTVNVSISGVDGKTVLERNDVKTVDISDLANGVYLLRVSNTAGVVVKIEKLVKTDN